MNQESGRSMIEVIGIMAIAAVFTVGAISIYNTIRSRQTRMVVGEELKTIVQNTKLIYSSRGDYAGVSVDRLIAFGVLKDARPIMGSVDGYFIRSENLGKEFSINLTGISFGDCAYFTTAKLDWANEIRVNGYSQEPGAYCMRGGANEVSFIIK